MSMETFEGIVEGAKRQELEIKGLEQLNEKIESELKDLKKTLNAMKKSRIVKDTEVIENKPGKQVSHIPAEDIENHIATVQSVPRLTVRNGLITAKVHFINDTTGRDTTKTAGRRNMIDAIIARNEIAATLLKEGKINIEEFRKATELPEGLIL